MLRTERGQFKKGGKHQGLIDLTGKTFGKWTVLFRAEHNDSKGGARWVCVCDCGVRKVLSSQPLRRDETKSCGCSSAEFLKERTGSRSSKWKGGRYVRDNGYVLVHVETFYPECKAYYPDRGSVDEHVLVMARHLKRRLFRHEQVHHKNGVRDDNRLDNLELWSKQQPAGQRVKDKLAWAREILRLYEKDEALL